MVFSNLDIVRDCWWLMPSGEGYITDENGSFSTYAHGLYNSINASGVDTYLEFGGSGTISYYGRLEHNNVDVDTVEININETDTDFDHTLYINGIEVGNLKFQVAGILFHY